MVDLLNKKIGFEIVPRWRESGRERERLDNSNRRHD